MVPMDALQRPTPLLAYVPPRTEIRINIFIEIS